MIVPVFPLTGAFLFPGALMPLHIFEPRYLQMVDDLLDTAGRLVIAPVAGDVSEDSTPRLHRIGGLGEINGHKRLPDGRYLIVLIGLGRYVIDEVPSDRLYRRVEAEPLEEHPIPEGREPPLRDRLIEAVRSRSNDRIEETDEISTDRLADVLMMLLHQQAVLDTESLSRLYGEVSLERRASRVLAEHDDF